MPSYQKFSESDGAKQMNEVNESVDKAEYNNEKEGNTHNQLLDNNT